MHKSLFGKDFLCSNLSVFQSIQIWIKLFYCHLLFCVSINLLRVHYLNLFSVFFFFLIFINDLLDAIKSEIKLFVRLLSKETTQMDLNKLSYWEDIGKLLFNIEKCNVLEFVFQNIPVESKLSNGKVQKVNDKCDVRVSFDDTAN